MSDLSKRRAKAATPAVNLDTALALQDFDNEQRAHENLRSAIQDSANALELITPSDPPQYYAPPVFRSLLREPWTLALLTRQWDDDPTPQLPKETDLPDHAATKKSLDSLWDWSKRTLDRLIPPLAEDDSAYRPASEFIDSQRFPTMKAIRQALTANPTIRTCRPTGKNGKPIRNRLNIHAGDWHAAISKQTSDSLDLPATVVDAVMEIERRKQEIRKQKEAEK